MSEYYNRHNRLSLACPVSNLSPVFGPSIKRNKRSDHLATRETASYILFSAKTRIYKQNTLTYTQIGAENALFQVCLTITEPFSPI